jgi:hypothetical protein
MGPELHKVRKTGEQRLRVFEKDKEGKEKGCRRITHS